MKGRQHAPVKSSIPPEIDALLNEDQQRIDAILDKMKAKDEAFWRKYEESHKAEREAFDALMAQLEEKSKRSLAVLMGETGESAKVRS